MSFDSPLRPQSRVRRFWARYGNLAIFWLLVLVMVAVFFGATWLAFTVGVRGHLVP